ncbi:MAG TPA: hypothetical protein VGJ70_13425, partial [Solirubrobacteraceae bacterium]
MTRLLVGLAVRRPPSQLVRPSAVAAFALALAYTSGATIAIFHAAAGEGDARPPLLVHWLRDGT